MPMGSNSIIINRRESIGQLRSVDYFSRIGLYLSQALLFIGFWLVFFDYFGAFSYQAMLWSYRMVDIWIIFIGLLISFGCVPYLYFSSLIKFKKNDPFWDVETFWIFILFMAGMFFQYGSGREHALSLIVISVAATFVLHIYFMFLSNKIKGGFFDENHGKLYFEGMKYLVAYYVLTLTIFGLLNPIEIARAMFG